VLSDLRYVRALYVSNATTAYRYQELSNNFVCDGTVFPVDIEIDDKDPATDDTAVLTYCEVSDVDGNGLSQPTIVDLNGDRVADRVYAGDLHGNFWAFDISNQDNSRAFINKTEAGTEADKWGIAHISDKPLFVACRGALSGNDRCSEADRQPITAAPTIRSNPRERGRATSPNTLALFGTGQYITMDDNDDLAEQSFYGIWDAGESHGGLTRSNLASQVIIRQPETAIDRNNDGDTTIAASYIHFR